MADDLKARVYAKSKTKQKRNLSSRITVFVVLQVVIWPRAPELGQVLLVVELQEVGPFPPETQEGRRQAARQGHEPPRAANAETNDDAQINCDICFQRLCLFKTTLFKLPAEALKWPLPCNSVGRGAAQTYY